MPEVNNEFPEGFKMTELGPLPEDWEVVRLGDAATFTRKPRGLRLEAEIPFIPMELIPNNGFTIRNYMVKVPNEIRSGVYCEKGDILLPRITPCFENGKQGILLNIPKNFAFATTEVFPLKTKATKIETFFLFYFLLQPNVRRDIAGKMEGTTGRQRIPKAVVKNYFIPLPPLPEQQKIAAVLSAVQEAREKTEDVIKATRELKKSLMKHLFTYGPVPLNEAENVPLKETEIGPIPEHWEMVRLKSVCITKTSFPAFSRISSLDTKDDGDVAILALKVSDMNLPSNTKYITQAQNFFRYPGNDVKRKQFLKQGSIVFPKRGGAIATNKKRITGYDCILDPNMIGVEPTEIIINEYLYGFFCQIDLRLLQDNTPIPQLNKHNVEKILLSLPPLPEQQKIAQILSAVDEKIESEENKKKALEGLFKSLLSNLMTGRIRVKDLNF